MADDDQAVRSMLELMLESAGWKKVLTASNGVAAIEEVDRQSGQVDVVVMDIEMPIMHGSDAARMIRARHPNIGILFISGEFHGPTFQEMPDWGILLPKPFKVRELLEAIDLAQRQPQGQTARAQAGTLTTV